MWQNVPNIPLFVPRATYVPAGSRNPPASISAGSRNRPVSISAGRPFSAGWRNHIREDGKLLLRPQQVVLGK
ncbi:hypothetical protein Tco_0556288 [Tanacetum coccineum]